MTVPVRWVVAGRLDAAAGSGGHAARPVREAAAARDGGRGIEVGLIGPVEVPGAEHRAAAAVAVATDISGTLAPDVDREPCEIEGVMSRRTAVAAAAATAPTACLGLLIRRRQDNQPHQGCKCQLLH